MKITRAPVRSPHREKQMPEKVDERRPAEAAEAPPAKVTGVSIPALAAALMFASRTGQVRGKPAAPACSSTPWMIAAHYARRLKSA